MKVKFNIGGVPEHFNLPWYLAIERGDFINKGIQLDWEDYPDGTGAMCADLRSGSIDIAVLLTEGIVSDIIKGNPSKILQLYVKTPLVWGVHVPGQSLIKKAEDIAGKKYAISRRGSGSHLMAFVDAQKRGLTLRDDQLVIVNNLEGARHAFQKKEAEVFMWEKLMTKPFVDTGEFRRVAERPTPWPCFVIAAREEVVQKYPGEILTLLETIKQSSVRFMNDNDSPDIISAKFGFSREDAVEWFSKTRWATDPIIEKDVLTSVVDNLFDLKMIGRKVSVEELCSFCELV